MFLNTFAVSIKNHSYVSNIINSTFLYTMGCTA